MTKKLSAAVAALLVLTAVTPAAVIAQTADGGTSTEPVIIDETTGEVKVTNDLRSRIRSDVKDRIEQARKDIKEKLDAARKERIKQRCDKIQTKIADAKKRAEQFRDKHTGIYDRWVERIGNLLARLDKAGADTTQLKADLKTLSEKTATAKEEFNSYVDSIGSVEGVDCTGDPQGFYDALQQARAARGVLLDDLKAVREFARNTIRQDLLNIKDQLKAKQAKAGSQEK